MSFSRDYRSPASASGWNAQASVDAGLRSYMLRVYNWMASGLLLTGIVAYVIANTTLSALFFQQVMAPSGALMLRPTLLGDLAMLSPLAFVLVMSFGINRLSLQGAQMLFWAFAAAMGASLSSIFAVYTGTSIMRVFLVTSCMFAATSLWGYTTKANLMRFSSFMMMGLFGLLITGLVNMFLHSATVYYLYSAAGVLIFTAFCAFDAQRIRMTYMQVAAYESPEMMSKRSVYDALNLYLNFINLFQFMLQFMGVRNSGD